MYIKYANLYMIISKSFAPQFKTTSEKINNENFTLKKIFETAPPKTKKLFEMDAPTYMKNFRIIY